MYIINVLALLIVLIFISYKFNIAIVESVPIGISLLVLMLYALSFFRVLNYIDYIGMLILALGLIFLIRGIIRKDNNVIRIMKQSFNVPSFWLFLILTVTITICVQNKITTWWDDYNFWSTDVKSIYYLNGFANKYANVAPEFGDYPPGTQLIKWWFLHFDPNSFREGLMFAGYYFMLFGFLCPFLKFFDRKKPYYSLIALIAILFLPSCIEAFYADGCCADICMALAYGNFLISVIDDERKDEKIFYYGRAALYLSLMVLCKNTSIIWLLFSFIFAVFYKMATGNRLYESLKRWFFVYLIPGGVLASWYGFCLINRRVAKLTGNSIKMATGSMGIPEIRSEIVKSFFEGFFKYPIHRYNNWIVDLSPALFFVLIIAAYYVVMSTYGYEKRKKIFFVTFMAVSGFIFYAFNFVCHITIFATEDQYLEPFAMASSIERYSSPFSFGAVLLLVYIILKHQRSVKPLVVTALIIFLTTDPFAVHRAYLGYADSSSSIAKEREMLINDEIRELEEKYSKDELTKFKRILYIRNVEDLSWVSHAYINFELSPLSVVYEYIDSETKEEELVNMAVEAHANYIYMNRQLYEVQNGRLSDS